MIRILEGSSERSLMEHRAGQQLIGLEGFNSLPIARQAQPLLHQRLRFLVLSPNFMQGG
jgi:hypothetical protein